MQMAPINRFVSSARRHQQQHIKANARITLCSVAITTDSWLALQSYLSMSMITVQEVDDLFYKYGKVQSIDIKPGLAAGQPAYCFVEFGDPDDAYDAVKAMDGKEVFSKRLRVGDRAY